LSSLPIENAGVSPQAEDETVPGGDQIGPYELLDEIGAGGFGRVYRARHVQLDEIRAIKLATDPELARQLRKEGRVLSRLRHPRIVLVYDMDVEHDPPYIVMEYVEGGDLRQKLEQGPLPVEDALWIMLDVLEALEHAHSEGVIHRDIKPSNILLDRDGRAKVSDFGLGRIVEEASMSWGRVQSMRSGSGEVSGTLKYMSPEQLDPSLLKGEELDGRSDLYSLGLVFYEMLTGEFPAGVWDPPSQVRTEVPASLDEVVRRVLAGRRERRHGSAAEVAGELRVVLDAGEADRRQREEEERRQAEKARSREEEETRRQERIRQLTGQARQLHEASEYEEAKARWQEVIALGGDEETAKAAIAGTEAALARTEADRRQKEEQEQKARDAEQRRVEIQRCVQEAELAYAQGEHRQAIAAWQQVLRLDAEHVDAPKRIDDAQRRLHECEVTRRRRKRAGARLWWRRVGVRAIGAGLAVALAAVGLAVLHSQLATGTSSPQSAHGKDRSPPTGARKGQVWVSPKDGKEMVYVPAGEFLMGSRDDEAPEWECPQRKVYLDAFWIDKTEVTNAEYRKFAEARDHRNPQHWDDPEFNQPQQPVVGVRWADATAYAGWAGKRLPTEAEWEKAARGSDGRRYPWGNEEPGSSRCNLSGSGDGYATVTAPVGSFPSGASPYGCLDMAGNVWEWCADRHDSNYYKYGPTRNPKGPDSGTAWVIRGGSWGDISRNVRCANRIFDLPGTGQEFTGFRCARDAE
jgi:iron(II)-dependent oxidoreductase